jgi:hypothetical protein
VQLTQKGHPVQAARSRFGALETSMPVSSRALPAQGTATRTGSSIVRCGRCGETQRVDLSQSVLVQVRPFVQAHQHCGPDAISVPSQDRR